MPTYYLGLSTTGHDPALAIVDAEGRLLFAEATERFVQDKRAWGIAPDHVPHLERSLAAVGFDYERDHMVVASSWATVKADLPVQMHEAMLAGPEEQWLSRLQAQAQANVGVSLLRLGISREMPAIFRFDHHLCHAAAACFQAPMDDAICLVIDGEGEVGAASLFDLRGREIKRRWRSWGPGSLGTFYLWLTKLCGFDWRLGEEWKVMGLAAFGKVVPDLADAMEAMVVVDRGRLRFADQSLIDRANDLAIRHGRGAGDPIMQAANLAATGQAVYARHVDRLLASCADGGTGNLILSGGCALNSSYNGSIAGRAGFDSVFVPPAPADDGNAVGAAILAWMKDTASTIIPKGDGSPFLGVAPNPRTIEKMIGGCGAARITDISPDPAEAIAGRLAQGHIIGVLRDRAEFGPRALGNRSILADPRPADMKDRINEGVKGREMYRPFAPVVLEEQCDHWFERALSSPYMSFTLPWRARHRSTVPAVVHADGTGRLQTVTATSSRWMHDLVTAFGRVTDVPVILNTSFNVMGKPIVDSVEDALGALMTSKLDAALIGNILVEK